MSKCTKIKAGMLGLAIFLPMLVVAEPVQKAQYDAALTLGQLTEKVYQHLPEKTAESNFAQLQQANEQLAQRTFAEPSVANLTHFNDALGTGDGLQEWEGTVDMALWLPGQKQQQYQLAQRIGEQLPAYQQLLKLKASAEVRTLIWDIKIAETNLQEATIAWQTAQQLEHDVNARVEAGDLPNTEQLLASSHTLEAHNEVVAAQSELQKQLAAYHFKTGEQVLPAALIETLATSPVISEQHPLIQMHDQQIAVLQAEQSVARFDKSVNPNLSVGLRRERGDSAENFKHSVGVGISIALDNNRYNQTAVADVAVKLADAQVARQQTLRELNTQLLEIQQTLSMQQQQLAILKEQNKTTQAYLNLQKRAFELGEINLMSLLRSQAVANQNHSRLSLLEVERYRAISKLNQIVGIIL